MSHDSEQIVVERRDIAFTHPGKVLFPETGITKKDLLEYYQRIADVILPHLAGRPLILEQFPNGIGKKGFFHRKVPNYFPRWVGRVTMRKAGGKVTEVVANDAATLAYLAEQDCITLHAGLSRRDKLDHPDRMVIDLDPGNPDFSKVQSAAKILKDLLDRLELPSFVQLTGSRGMHAVVPLDRKERFDCVHAFARRLAEWLVGRHLDELTVEQRKDHRRGRVFLDYLRNSYSQTAVAPYSVRAREGAPIATPITWREAFMRGTSPDKYDIRSIFRRLANSGDPWSEIDRKATSLEKARRLLDSME